MMPKQQYKDFLIQRIMAWGAITGISTYTQATYAAETAQHMQNFTIVQLLETEQALYKDVVALAFRGELVFSDN